MPEPNLPVSASGDPPLPPLPPPVVPLAAPVPDLRAWVASWRGRVPPVVASLGALLAVVVLGAVAWSAYRGGAGDGPPPEVSMPRAGLAGDPSAASSPPTAAAGPAGAGAEVVVHVAGAVVRSGVYNLPAAARVADALAAAGGPGPDADVDNVNLAAKVEDGDRVYVPHKGEAPSALLPPGRSPPGAPGAGAAVVDLNRATADDLDALPGVGPATAAAIVKYRTEHGRFRAVDQLLDVPGIGPSKLANLRPRLRVR
jgi:competence protein ComEA